MSGLKEEIGKKIFNKKIYSNKKINLLKISNIIITAVGYEEDILKNNSFTDKKVYFLKINKMTNNLQKIQIKNFL